MGLCRPVSHSILILIRKRGKVPIDNAPNNKEKRIIIIYDKNERNGEGTYH